MGCGTGEILSIIRKLYPTVSLYGIDISKEMLKRAKEKRIDDVHFYLGDAERLPFENGKFNLLICTDSFHHYPNPQIAIDEFYRVLQNDGYLLLADYWKPFPLRQLMNIFIPFSNEGDVKVYSKQEIIHYLRNSGFKNIYYSRIDYSGYCTLAQK